MKLTTLKLIRMQCGALQIDVAQKAGLSRPRLSEIENGHVEPTPDELERLAGVLGVDAAQLLGERQ